MAQNSSPKSLGNVVVNEPKELNRARFELELEFVQALANPYYLHSLAQQNILSQPAFVNYLKYLLYWKEREYARFLQYVVTFHSSTFASVNFVSVGLSYPHALHHLDLLQHEQFRKEIGKDEWREKLNQLQYGHWKSW